MHYEINEAEMKIIQLDNVIKASENWADEYTKTPDQHAKLINTESKLESALRGYFRGLAERALTYISWTAYDAIARSLKADNLEVIVNIEDGPFMQEDALLIQVMYDPIEAAVALGATAGEVIYNRPIGLSGTDIEIQRAARELVAELVGKKLDLDGNIIDNPKAKYRIGDRTRKEIRESIRTSVNLGETIQEAQARVQKRIKNPKRAMSIARTETVNAYQKGLLSFGDMSGAVEKVWLSVNDNDVCGVYASLGNVPIDFIYDRTTKLKSPAAHPNCRCSLRLIYPEELAQ